MSTTTVPSTLNDEDKAIVGGGGSGDRQTIVGGSMSDDVGFSSIGHHTEPTMENIYHRIKFNSEQQCLLIDFSHIFIACEQHVENIRLSIESLLESHKAHQIHCLVNYDEFTCANDELMKLYTERVVRYLSEKYYRSIQRYTTRAAIQDTPSSTSGGAVDKAYADQYRCGKCTPYHRHVASSSTPTNCTCKSIDEFEQALRTANLKLGQIYRCVEVIGDRYVVEGYLGEGSFGKVRLAYDRNTGRKVAVKEMDMKQVRSMGIESFVQRELQIMQQLSEAPDAHENIVRWFNTVRHGDYLHIVLEYCSGGSLENTFDEHEQFPERQAHHYFCQIISALQYLHERHHIMHRDLQLANICRSDNDVIKIVDFGLADYFSPTEFKHTLFAGNVNYSPPEMLLEKRYKGPEVDLWASGCILYKMLTGYLPFRNAQRTLMGQFTIPLEEEEELSQEVKDFLCKMLNPDPVQRLTIAQIMDHPWWHKFA